MKTLKIDGVIVYWSGSSVEYILPAGFGALEMREFIERNEKTVKKFEKDCKAEEK